MNDCSFDTTGGAQTCTAPANVKQIIAKQPAGPDLTLWIARSWLVYPGVTVTATGANPVVLVALQTIDVEGTVSVSASGTTAGPGGAAYPFLATHDRAGGGPGGGGAGSATNAAAGGSGCGLGGAGAAWPGGTPAHGGQTQLTDTLLSPLVGGSSGGGGVGYPGGGGGAIQLVAALSVTIGVGGVVSAGGGGGGAASGMLMADGGGSGGAILIEALSVNTPGTLAANGGGGGGEAPATNAGASGSGSGLAAPGGGSEGGQGSSQTYNVGMAGLCPAGSCGQNGVAAGGGGGGAGRIRINSARNPLLGGTHSPDSGGCYTTGKVMP
jgi:hypothetical protein